MILLCRLLLLCLPVIAYADIYYEISGSPYATQNAPMQAKRPSGNEKVLIVNPREHVWGAYGKNGKLIRWGIATAGGDWCSDIKRSCRTHEGHFRLYSLGSVDCVSSKFPMPMGGAPMPYCMYFNGSEAIHGSHDVKFDNASHGCVRVHVSDAKWIRYQFAEGPNASNNYRGTLIIVKPYD